MGLAKRIIPCLDVNKGRVVKGTNFLDLKDAGDPVEIAKKYNDEGADEICFLDITATSDGRDLILDIIEKVANKVFIPLTVGGGVKEVEDIRRLLNSGADKVSINTSAILDPNLIKFASRKYGSQCIVVAIDAKKNKFIRNLWEVFSHGGRKNTGIDAIAWGIQMEKLGAGEILLTSMDRDGTKKGFDNELLKIFSTNLKIPVIASGGVGNLIHFLEGAKKGGADAMLAASVFHYGLLKIKDVKNFLSLNDIRVRI